MQRYNASGLVLGKGSGLTHHMGEASLQLTDLLQKQLLRWDLADLPLNSTEESQSSEAISPKVLVLSTTTRPILDFEPLNLAQLIKPPLTHSASSPNIPILLHPASNIGSHLNTIQTIHILYPTCITTRHTLLSAPSPLPHAFSSPILPNETPPNDLPASLFPGPWNPHPHAHHLSPSFSLHTTIPAKPAFNTF